MAVDPFTSILIYATISFLVAFVPIIIMLYASQRGFDSTVLCMDCQQCVAVCPVRSAIPQRLRCLTTRKARFPCPSTR